MISSASPNPGNITSIAALKVIYEVFGWVGTSVSTP
jgi:hypothetical protein